MKQNQKQKKLSGPEGFEEYYGALFGERWESLKQALSMENIHMELSWPGRTSYYMDPGSVAAALCLPVKESSSILDLCAAPGGKSLIIAGCKNKDAQLNSNERSSDRKARLVKVIKETLPEDISETVVTSCSDGALWCRRQEEAFDSILLDAPCSSERHVLGDMKYLKDWSPSRIKTLSMEQWALMSSAWRLLKKGGWLVYATCALNPEENDHIIDRLLKKFDDVEICSEDKLKAVFSENLKRFTGTLSGNTDLNDIISTMCRTERGFHVLPDTSNGAGPLFFILLQKKLK